MLHTNENRVPMIDFEAAGGVDVERLERSLGLRAEAAGQGRYRIIGGETEHWVDLYTASHPRCDCGDYLWRDRVCKHILAALMREGNERVIRAVGSLFAALRSAA
jgi:uncharacterized Zn finger protein